MILFSRVLAAGLLAAASLPAIGGSPALAQASPVSAAVPAHHAAIHRVVIQVSENDPKVMNLALNNAENLKRYYQDLGEKIEVEIVAYGPGLAMVRSDTSPVKDRLAALGHAKDLTISGCGNTMTSQSRQENKQISLVSEARTVTSGIVRIVELQEQGWTYIRP